MNAAPAGIDPALVYLVVALVAVAAALYAFFEARRLASARAAAEAQLAAAKARVEALEGVVGERDGLRAQLEAARAEASEIAAALSAEKSAAAARADAAKEREEALIAMKAEAEKSFLALAGQALDRNEQRFLALANETFAKHRDAAAGGVKDVLSPVQEAFAKLAGSVEALEKSRVEDKATLGEQMRSVSEAMMRTQDVTGKLVNALRAAPKTRGRWGEETLRNVLELAGLTPHVDFQEQSTHEGEGGKALRPDVIIRLPGNRSIIVDSKVALSGYLDAMDATDEAAREAHLKKHAAELKAHVRALASKDYWKAVPESADFVVLFVPGENFFAAAAEREPNLMQDAFASKVIIATPSTLIALAKAVAYGWRQEDAHRNAQEIAQLGRDLYNRLGTVVDRVGALGNSLDKSVKSYNEVVASMEARLLPQARRFKDLGAVESDDELARLEPNTLSPRLPGPPRELELSPPPPAPKGRKA
jgi:DNA recombination protein RmuC